MEKWTWMLVKVALMTIGLLMVFSGGMLVSDKRSEKFGILIGSVGVILNVIGGAIG